MTLTRWAVRAVLVLAALVFFLSLLAVGVALACVWGLRALWARLTGRPVRTWASMRVDPRAGWSTVYRSAQRWTPQTHAGAGEPTSGRRASVLQGADEVTDVQVREVREP
jgi:hypothetical protein